MLVDSHFSPDQAELDYNDGLNGGQPLTVPGSAECIPYTLMDLMCVVMCIVVENTLRS